MKIFLLGMPGSGKSTLGHELSRLLDTPFFDLDAEIERKEGRSIKAIFEDSGELMFREVEAATLRNLIAGHADFVMSTGGGAPCFHHNMEAMNNAGITILLDPPLPVLMERFSREGIGGRPLLEKVDNLEDHLRTTREKRWSFYSLATHRLGTIALAEDILSMLKVDR